MREERHETRKVIKVTRREISEKELKKKRGVKKRKKVQKQRSTVFKILKGFIISIFVILFLAALFIGGAFVYFTKINTTLKNDMDNKILHTTAATFKRHGYTVILDNKGNELGKFATSNYVYIESKDIPPNVKNATIAIEDNNFYKHKGIDPKGILRALFIDILNRGHETQGASTITQQLVKNVLLTQDKTISRKIEEMYGAVELEKKFNKSQILEYYLNNICYGNNVYGIESASQRYFSKSSKDLTLAETAFLVGIPNNPSLYNPLTNMQGCLSRQKLILNKMKELNFISEQQYKDALNQQIVLKQTVITAQPENYATSFAIYNATEMLMKENGFTFQNTFSNDAAKKAYNANYASVYKEYSQKIRSGGYTIHTTIDQDKQNKLQASISSGLSNFTGIDKSTKKYAVQGAGVVMDANSNVVAIVGGRDANDELNRAFLSARQPGSSIKPLVSYTPLFEKGYNPSSIFNDHAIPNGPSNDEKTYYGDVTVRKALAMSLNTIPFQIVNKLGANYCVPYLLNLDFRHIVQQDFNPIIAIGGFTNGATPVEMAGGYNTLRNLGSFVEPSCVTKVVCNNVNSINNTHETKQVYSKESAYMMTDTLKGDFGSDGTAAALKLNNQIAAGKTGTTSDCKDGWFTGYTPYYTTVIWVGADNPIYIDNLYGATYPGHIWQTFMNEIHTGLPTKDFNRPSTVVNKYVNPNTGQMVNYNTGVQDLFSKPILDKLAAEEKAKQEVIKKAEEKKANEQKEDYFAKEGTREKEVFDLYKKLLTIDYKTDNDMANNQELIDKLNSKVSTLTDTKKREDITALINKRLSDLQPDKDALQNQINEQQQAQEQAAQQAEQQAEQQEQIQQAQAQAQAQQQQEQKMQQEQAEQIAQQQQQQIISKVDQLMNDYINMGNITDKNTILNKRTTLLNAINSVSDNNAKQKYLNELNNETNIYVSKNLISQSDVGD